MKALKLVPAAALSLALPAAAFAASFAYVDTTGTVRMTEATTPEMAIAMAPGIAMTSGVLLLEDASLEDFGGSSSEMSDDSDTSSDEESEAAADLREALRDVLGEHVTTSMDVLRAIADEEDGSGDSSDVDDAIERQTMNSEDVAAAIASVYGTEAGDMFETMFKEHVVASNDYTRAVAMGDDEAADEAYDELIEYLQDVTDFLATANPFIDNATLLTSLTQHENLLNESSEAYIDGNEDESQDLEDEAVVQIMGGADYLADAIIMQYPDKF